MVIKHEISDKLDFVVENQREILEVLRSIDNHIVEYFGEKYELKEKTLKERVAEANFSRKQFEIVQEVINYVKEKYSSESAKDN